MRVETQIANLYGKSRQVRMDLSALFIPSMNAIAITLYRRPKYTRQMLTALAKCFGIESFTVYFSIDWSDEYQKDCSEVLELVNEWKAAPKKIFVNYPKLGIDVNKFFIGAKAFAESEFVIFLEDDIVPARDFLQFMVLNAMKHDGNDLLSVCGYNRNDSPKEADLYRAWRDHCFHAWGWGMWRSTWDRLFMNGAFEYRKWAGDKVNGLFDHYLAKVAQAEGLWTVMPVIARTQNIGLEAGEHSTPETFATDYNARGAWDFELHEYLGEWKLGGADESV